MKKFIFMMIAMLSMVIGANAQATNYAGSSKFTDNWSLTLQGGAATPFDHCFTDGSTTPIVVLGVDKYITPWFGLGVEGRTAIGAGENWNIHTAFDQVNVSGYAKVNLANLFAFNGKRHFFEPVVYAGLGWGHICCSDAVSLSDNYAHDAATIYVNGQAAKIGLPTEDFGWIRNYLTGRAGVELNFNLGKERAWAIAVNPSVVWGNIDNGRLCKANGNFEVTAGVVYHFKTSNGTHSFTKAKLYDQAEIDALNARINELQNQPAKVVEKVVERTVTTPVAQAKYVVPFAFDSAELTTAGKAELDKIAAGTTTVIDAYASTEPKTAASYNTKLSENRAAAVKAYLESRGVNVADANACGGNDDFGRVAVVTLK